MIPGNSSNPYTPKDLCVLIAAGGEGRRMGAVVPKQHLQLAGRSVIEWSVTAMDHLPGVSQLIVVASSDDQLWVETSELLQLATPLQTVPGASTRSGSVKAGLEWIVRHSGEDTWVLVHDAARPLVEPSDCLQLVEQVITSGCDGGLLGVPAIETIKRVAKNQRVLETVDREQIWLAMTPQMFRAGPLLDAITNAMDLGVAVTDEASAMEMAGYQPLIVEGRRDNLKITHPDDIALAEHLLNQHPRQWASLSETVASDAAVKGGV